MCESSQPTILLLVFCIVTLGCSLDNSSKTPVGLLDMSQLGPGDYLSQGLDRDSLKSQRVLDAMSRVPRHHFVPKHLEQAAYQDRALSIGHGQTISQPYIVALMTQEANIDRGSRVLEVGTGSGYQAAVLAELGAKVFSIEIIPELAEQARRVLSQEGYPDIEIKVGDAWDGWLEQAPFDAILITAAARELSPKLISQLANRGRMIVPIHFPEKDAERLMVIERDGETFITRDLGAVQFVPFVRDSKDEPAETALETTSPSIVEVLKFGNTFTLPEGGEE